MALHTVRPHIIGIAGPSGAGKSELANRLAQKLGGAAIMTLDSYYRPMDDLPLERRRKSNFDLPEALEWELLFEHLRRLRAGQAIDEPLYDFTRHTRAPSSRLVEPGEYVIVEGLFTLYWDEVRGALDTKVFVKTAPPVCFERRLARDVAERGRTPECVREQYEKTVRPSAEAYIWPTERFADVVVSGEQSIEASTAAILAGLRARSAVA
jgi:uridine kinase